MFCFIVVVIFRCLFFHICQFHLPTRFIVRLTPLIIKLQTNFFHGIEKIRQWENVAEFSIIFVNLNKLSVPDSETLPCFL